MPPAFDSRTFENADLRAWQKAKAVFDATGTDVEAAKVIADRVREAILTASVVDEEAFAIEAKQPSRIQLNPDGTWLPLD